MEVPEIYDGIVKIVSAAREPGKRAKISVYSKDPDVDPVGSCVGIRGSRVQNIVNELYGEKIDIVRWNEDVAVYTTNALAPAVIDKLNKSLPKISIEKALKGVILITTGTKNGVIRRLLSYIPSKTIATIAINQYKKQKKWTQQELKRDHGTTSQRPWDHKPPAGDTRKNT